MKTEKRPTILKTAGAWFITLMFFLAAAPVWSYPVTFTDDSGQAVTLTQKPARVVSLVPSVTEIIFAIGAGDAVKGITYHSTHPPETSRVAIMGGFFSPSVDLIRKADPDIMFVSDLHQGVVDAFRDGNCRLIHIRTQSIADSLDDIRLLGKIFDRESQANALVAGINQDLDLIHRKVSRIPEKNRKRVIRLMGRNRVMTPGKDSFQNELIRSAGGIPPDFVKEGNIVEVTLAQWQRFNPEVVYGCGGDSETADAFFRQPGWKDVDAVKNGKVFYFPCDLTCRASAHTGYFVAWLSSMIYSNEFSDRTAQILNSEITDTRPVIIDLPYVKEAKIAYSRMDDFVNKTLLVDFNRPMTVVSTLEGQRDGITTVGNHYSSPPCWSLGHHHGLPQIRQNVLQVIHKPEKTTSLLFTGADMDNLSVQKTFFKEMRVTALVTAGVRGNAVRMARDEGKFYEPGTINVIVMTNMDLSPRAMTRAIISATEGKTAALLDMDIRSSYTPRRYRATGTGTDNMIVVQGTGRRVENAGGHSKLGELIARAVYKGVQEAVYKQNGLVAKRSVFHRLKERKISVLGLISKEMCDCVGSRSEFSAEVEKALLDPRVAGFIEASFALSDEVEKGLVRNLGFYRDHCRNVAETIAETGITDFKSLTVKKDLPEIVDLSINAVLNGVYYRMLNSQKAGE